MPVNFQSIPWWAWVIPQAVFLIPLVLGLTTWQMFVSGLVGWAIAMVIAAFVRDN